MDVRPFDDRERWSSFLLAYAPRSGAFLHSWEWGALHHAARVGFFQGEELVGIASLESKALPCGWQYVFCPRGPVFSTGAREGTDLLAAVSHFFARQKNVFFVRMEPARQGAMPSVERRLVATTSVSPSRTLILSLDSDLQTLLSDMHPKTRYNIRLSERKGVRVEKAEAKRLAEVWPIFVETAKRDGFRLHRRRHYEKILTEVPGTALFVARLGSEALAVAITIDFAGARTYLHGASRFESRQVMAPHLLHWELLKDAKVRGLRAYDWWGIANSDKPDDPWAGITRFKKGFGGEEVVCPGTFDLVLDPLRYSLYTIGRKMARFIRSRG